MKNISKTKDKKLKSGLTNLHKCYLCDSSEMDLVSSLTEKPERETDFGIGPKDYRREIYLCRRCGVYDNIHSYDFQRIYTKKYNKSTYNNDLLGRYNAIMDLPFERSDNKHRVKRISDFYGSKKRDLKGMKVLDVGSGLCVFLGEFVKRGIEGYCLDPDPLSVEHALKHAGVKRAYAGNFLSCPVDMKFDLITFNKVLEHITEPVSFLRRAKDLLIAGGFIYLELPDGPNALANGELVKREEFYIEHYTVFSEKSVRFLSEVAELKVVELSCIKEPSDKYTICAFLSNKG